MTNTFDLHVLQLHWLQEDPTTHADDLCAHGSLYVRIGQEVLSDASTGSWSLSTTALYLMRTAFQDYTIGDFGAQLIPCCGHFFIASEDGKSVVITGCFTGIDWNIQHLPNSKVRHHTAKGAEAIIELKEYKTLVAAFADAVEQLYKDSIPKVIPTDDFDRQGYLAFWTEWRSLRAKLF